MYIPSGDTTVLDVAFLACRPEIIHFISAGGLDGAVVHCNGTGSPTLASDGPEMETCNGATVHYFFVRHRTEATGKEAMKKKHTRTRLRHEHSQFLVKHLNFLKLVLSLLI